MKRTIFCLFALASVAGACDDREAPALAIAADDDVIQLRSTCDLAQVDTLFTPGFVPQPPNETAIETNFCLFLEECGEIANGKPTCELYEEWDLFYCTCGGEMGCIADFSTYTYTCGYWGPPIDPGP